MKKHHWLVAQFMVLLLYPICPLLGCLINQPLLGWLAVGAILLLHNLELFITIPLIKNKAYPYGKGILKTLLFGFTWWLPFKQGTIN